MTESHPRPAKTARPIRGPHGGWQKDEVSALRQRIEEAAQTGESLRSVFERIGSELGRKPNSIRNFYYAQLRAQVQPDGMRALPFETFTPEEVEQLVEQVLMARAQGMSVRACVRRLANGDKARMLRYQNKYRSVIRTRSELVHRVMQRLGEQGVPYVSPYSTPEQVSAPEPAQRLPQLKEKAAASGDPQIAALFEALDHLLSLAAHQPAQRQETDARRADRLSARNDLLRIRLDDEQARYAQLQAQTDGMVTLIKEYIALPPAKRSAGCEAFCVQAAARLSAVECALMQPEKPALPED